jgi:hypothetical protein
MRDEVPRTDAQEEVDTAVEPAHARRDGMSSSPYERGACVKFRVGRAVAAALAIAAATLMATAGSAAADPPRDWDHVHEATGVRIYFEEHGDIVSVCDAKANGHSASVIVYAPEPHFAYKMTVSTGAGTCKSHRASDGGKYNLEEQFVRLNFDGNGGGPASVQIYNDH